VQAVESQNFVFEKKKQKTFARLSRTLPPRMDKVFLFLFVHKKKTFPV